MSYSVQCRVVINNYDYLTCVATLLVYILVSDLKGHPNADRTELGSVGTHAVASLKPVTG